MLAADLRRMRLRYAHCSATLVAALARELPEWRTRTPGGGGLHTLVDLPAGVDEPALLAAAARHDVGIEGLSPHSYAGDSAPGLVLGHAHQGDAATERGVQLLGVASRA